MPPPRSVSTRRARGACANEPAPDSGSKAPHTCSPWSVAPASASRACSTRWLAMSSVRRALVVVNKADRMPDDVERVREHLASSLRDAGLNGIPVAVTSATQDGEVRELREWIAQGVEAKRVISARISTEVREAAADLAARAGVVNGAPVLVSAERRTRTLADVTREASAVIDLRGLERQAVAATRLAARPRGAGPFGHLTALAYKASGRDRTAADPEGYLRRWRERGALARPAEPVRALIAELMATVPPETRRALASLVDVEALRARLASAIDAAVAARTTDVRAPTSFIWTVIGALQYAVTAGLLFVGLWIAAVFLLHAPFASLDVPVLGPIPTPLVALAALLLAGYILARMLGAHAGLVGRRWARRLRNDLMRELETRLADALFAPLAAIDASRARISAARATIEKECGPST